MKAHTWTSDVGPGAGMVFKCPGCGSVHVIPTAGEGPCWKWNGDLDRPVLSPSVLVRWNQGKERIPQVCHSFVGCNGAQPGQIIFLSDCTHALAGQVVDLTDWDWDTL